MPGIACDIDTDARLQVNAIKLTAGVVFTEGGKVKKGTEPVSIIGTIAASIVHSKLDYCNSLWYNLPKSEVRSELACTYCG